MSETLFPFPDAEAPEVVEEEKGEARVVAPNRDQMELRAVDLESLLVLDHPARAVWEFVESLDLSPLYAAVGSVEGRAGRPAVDPRIYMSLWLYAVIEGV